MISKRFLIACAVSGFISSTFAQPVFENPSATAGSDTSQKANAMADKGMYKEVQYVNAGKRGPNLVVIPGEIKSNNATFTQKFSSNNIADFGELELGKANFGILERSDMGPLMKEFQLAYTMGDPNAARKILQKGKLKTTKWVIKFDVIKAEQVAKAQEGFDGRAAGQLLSIVGGGRGGAAAGVAVGSVQILALNLANAIVQTLVTDELRGRVMGIYSLVFFGFMPIGGLLAGAAAQYIGEPETVVVSALISLGVAALVWAFLPKVRALR